jgi:hypothetical protein
MWLQKGMPMSRYEAGPATWRRSAIFQNMPWTPTSFAIMKKELLRLGGTRDQIVKALKSAILKPDQREQFKKALSLYDAKIRKLRDQLIASELLGNLNPDEINIPTHYQDRKR